MKIPPLQTARRIAEKDKSIFAAPKLAEAMLEAGFEEAKLSNIRLEEGDYYWNNFNFSGVDCTNAIFDNVILEKTNFTNVNCTNASFKKCNMQNVDFSGADLTEVDFEGANILNIKWNEVTNFTGIKNLDKAQNAEKLIKHLNSPIQDKRPSFIKRTLTSSGSQLKELAKSFSSEGKNEKEESLSTISSSYPPRSNNILRSKSEKVIKKDDKQERVNAELKERFEQNPQGRQ